MRLLKRVAKIMAWGWSCARSSSAVVGYFAYALVTDSETAARLIKAQVATVLASVRLSTWDGSTSGCWPGEVTVSHIPVRQRIDGQSFVTATIPWLSVRIDARADVPRQVSSPAR